MKWRDFRWISKCFVFSCPISEVYVSFSSIYTAHSLLNHSIPKFHTDPISVLSVIFPRF